MIALALTVEFEKHSYPSPQVLWGLFLKRQAPHTLFYCKHSFSTKNIPGSFLSLPPFSVAKKRKEKGREGWRKRERERERETLTNGDLGQTYLSAMTAGRVFHPDKGARGGKTDLSVKFSSPGPSNGIWESTSASEPPFLGRGGDLLRLSWVVVDLT